MKKKLLETGKAILIAALALNAAMLLARIALSHNGVASSRDVFVAVQRLFRSTSDSAPEVLETAEAALPVQAAVMLENGRYGIVSGFEEMDRLYNTTGAIFAEALGSAEKAVSIKEDAWADALSEKGLYFAFDVKIPVAVLAGWLSITGDENFAASRFILACGSSDMVTLLYSDGISHYSCKTSAKAQTLIEQLESCRPNGAKFAFELSDTQIVFANVDPYSLIIDAMNTSLPSYGSSDTLNKAAVTELMEKLELNPYAKSPYEDKDGWLVYAYSSGGLRISGDGRAVFTVGRGENFDLITAQRYGNDGISDATAIESTRVFAKQTVEKYCGDARVYMSGYETEGNAVTVTYSYYLNGLKTLTPQFGHAARFRFVNGIAVQMELEYRTYSRQEEPSNLLRPLYAAAIYPDHSGQLLTAGYQDFNSGIVSANWIIK